MGTNYYVVADGPLGQQRLHVGKSSAGWTFNFQALEEMPDGSAIRCTEDWRKALADLVDHGPCRLVNEYGDAVTTEEFWRMVEQKHLWGDPPRAANRHAVHYPDGNYLDDEGESFSTWEFS